MARWQAVTVWSCTLVVSALLVWEGFIRPWDDPLVESHPFWGGAVPLLLLGLSGFLTVGRFREAIYARAGPRSLVVSLLLYAAWLAVSGTALVLGLHWIHGRGR
jgi:hypothetical protein